MDSGGFTFTDRQVAKLAARFDINGNDQIDVTEFQRVVLGESRHPLDGSGGGDGGGGVGPTGLQALHARARALGMDPNAADRGVTLSKDKVTALLRARYAGAASLAATYRAWNTSRSGVLSKSELHRALAGMGINVSDATVAELVAEFDDGSQAAGAAATVSFEEFCRLVWGTEKEHVAATFGDKVKQAWSDEQRADFADFWSRVDAVKARVGPVALASRMAHLQNKLIGKLQAVSGSFRTLFRRMDRDGDGCVSYEELRHVVRGLGMGMSKEDIDLLIGEDWFYYCYL